MDRKITILVDNDSWIIPYAEQLVSDLIEMGISAILVRDHESVMEGWINFMLGCVKIVSQEVLARNQHNLVVHESDLPDGKGFAPMTWQILEGKNEIPICLIEASQEVDAGEVWLRDIIELDGTELCPEWRRRQGEKTVELCIEFVENYYTLEPEIQSEAGFFYRKRTHEDSELNIDESIRQSFDLLRVVDNNRYPGYFYINNVKYLLKIEKI